MGDDDGSAGLTAAAAYCPPCSCSVRRTSCMLALIAEGRSNAAIARRLRVSEKAVVHNASTIYDELGLQASQHDLSPASGRIPALDGEHCAATVHTGASLPEPKRLWSAVISVNHRTTNTVPPGDHRGALVDADPVGGCGMAHVDRPESRFGARLQVRVLRASGRCGGGRG